MSLAGGEDGLDAVRGILRDAPRFLNPQGVLVVEIGHNRDACELAFPRLPFLWLDTGSSTESVFLLKREDTRRRPLMSARTGGELLVASLVAQGATHAFGVPGESFLPVLDALHDVARPAELRGLPAGRRRGVHGGGLRAS